MGFVSFEKSFRYCVRCEKVLLKKCLKSVYGFYILVGSTFGTTNIRNSFIGTLCSFGVEQTFFHSPLRYICQIFSIVYCFLDIKSSEKFESKTLSKGTKAKVVVSEISGISLELDTSKSVCLI